MYVHTPIITGSDCEGAGEMFQVTTLDLDNVPKTEDGQVDYSQDFFGKKTSLTVSGQLNAENFAMAFGDVYTFGPTFRAENSNTQRHAAEFWMIEPEMAFCDLAGDMDVAEAMIKHIIRSVLERCPEEIDFFNSFVDKGLMERLEHVADLRLRPRQLHRGRGDSQKAQRPVRLQGGVGHRSADRARALSDRAGVQEAGVCHRLSQGDQGVLYAPQRRRQDRGRGGLPGARHRRDHRRQPARGASGRCWRAASRSWA